MLSSILERLHSLKNSFVPDMWLATIDLCAASYPDVQPWQVRAVCVDQENDRKMELEDIYYIYLSQLLHPMDGHDAARKNRDLVRVRTGTTESFHYTVNRSLTPLFASGVVRAVCSQRRPRDVSRQNTRSSKKLLLRCFADVKCPPIVFSRPRFAFEPEP